MSNLPYLSKNTERVVAAKLSVHMSEYNLCEPNQSAYKPNHGVETALVCVQNDILLAMDNQNIVIMLLLDLSAAFDTFDRSVMLHRLSHDVGVVQTALDWFKSYLSDEVQSVHINGCTSSACTLTCGVPQDSVLGPQLFSIYAAPLSKIIHDAAVECIERCVTEIRIWNENKLLEVERFKNKSNIIQFNSTAKESQAASVACWLLFGQGEIDAEMTMESHVTAVCKSAIFHPQHLNDHTVSDSSSDRASPARICYKQTRCWQCTAISTASEANTTASDSTELRSPLDRRRYVI